MSAAAVQWLLDALVEVTGGLIVIALILIGLLVVSVWPRRKGR